jgi:hypothetical protein
MALWINLLTECELAVEGHAEDLARRIHAYAHWCWLSPSGDVSTAVACAFYEHLPTSPALRRDLPKRLSHGLPSHIAIEHDVLTAGYDCARMGCHLDRQTSRIARSVSRFSGCFRRTCLGLTHG